MMRVCETWRVGRWLAVWALTLAFFAGLDCRSWAAAVGYAEYFVFGDEEHIIDAYQAIPAAAVPPAYVGSNLNSRLSIVSSADGNHVYLDEWEDGYEFSATNPFNTADAKWDSAVGGTNDFPALARGQVLVLWETNRYVANSQGVDAGDRIFISGAPVDVVRAVWPDSPPDPGSYIAGAWELYPIQGCQDLRIRFP